jgi:hypothetical protein
MLAQTDAFNVGRVDRAHNKTFAQLPSGDMTETWGNLRSCTGLNLPNLSGIFANRPI